MHVFAEIKPSDILVLAGQLAGAAVGIALLVGLLRLLLEPIVALFTGAKVSEDSMTLWVLILVAATIAGLIAWQLS